MLNANHRHITLTIPAPLRACFFKNGLLLKKFLETACNTIHYAYTLSCPDRMARPGIIAVLHTSGGRLNFNPHVHMLITEGLLSEETTDNGDPVIYPLSRPHFRNMNLLWRNKVLALLRNMRVIDEAAVNQYKQQYAHGFYIDVRFKATYDNRQEREKLAQYLIRQPIGENRISRYNGKRGLVSIWYKVERDEENSRNIYKKESMDVYEFIARRIQHILPHHMQKVRFYGIYSNKYRGLHRKVLKQLQPDHTGVARNNWNGSWRRLIWKIYDADPILCTTCGTEMRIRKVITTGADREIRKLTDIKYYISGRWRIEKRKQYLGPMGGKERRCRAA